jgi:ribonuclease Z
MDNGKIFVRASTLKHTVISFGYVVEEHNIPGRLIPDLAMAKGLTPGPAYRALKKGENVLLPSGKILFASEVTGPPALGRKVAIFGDTADSSKMFDIAKNCDVSFQLFFSAYDAKIL